ncbi:MAG TPA: exosortase E/protease, VPEID-CTERM system [Polyangiaceae bacterium]|nr:exosortase E/protease, VPEID-CTERM system [Polyangiaceae bacterium]
MPSSPRAAAVLRLVSGLVALSAEYFVLAISFDGTRLTHAQGWWAHVGNVSNLVALGLVILTGTALAGRREIRDAWQALIVQGPGPVSWRFLCVHIPAFASFLWLSWALFAAPGLVGAHPGAVISAWFVAGLGSCLTLLRFFFGQSWLPLSRACVTALPIGAALGCVAWWLAWKTRFVWPWFEARTLPVAGLMLRTMAPGAWVDADSSVLGLGEFFITVEPECSGVEGIGVVSVFMVAYLALFRRQLRWPNALALIPVAAAFVWLFNAARIALLVVIGARVSASAALGGFHSKAGWVGVCGVALGFVALSDRMKLFAREIEPAPVEKNPATAYCIPLFLALALAMITGLGVPKDGIDWLYGLRVLGAGALLFAYRREYGKVLRFDSWVPVALGALVFAVWLPLSRYGANAAPSQLPRELSAAGPAASIAWLVFRVLGAVLTVPLSEELAFRGFLQRRLISADFETVDQGKFSWPSFLLGSAAFGTLHQNWLGGLVAGAVYALATYRRGQLSDAILAHATSNALIAVAVLGFDQWHLW